jgi:hypothetical protein
MSEKVLQIRRVKNLTGDCFLCNPKLRVVLSQYPASPQARGAPCEPGSYRPGSRRRSRAGQPRRGQRRLGPGQFGGIGDPQQVTQHAAGRIQVRVTGRAAHLR